MTRAPSVGSDQAPGPRFSRVPPDSGIRVEHRPWRPLPAWRRRRHLNRGLGPSGDSGGITPRTHGGSQASGHAGPSTHRIPAHRAELSEVAATMMVRYVERVHAPNRAVGKVRWWHRSRISWGRLAGSTSPAPRAAFGWVSLPRRWIASFPPSPTCPTAGDRPGGRPGHHRPDLVRGQCVSAGYPAPRPALVHLCELAVPPCAARAG
jgi:hypothetical protein